MKSEATPDKHSEGSIHSGVGGVGGRWYLVGHEALEQRRRQHALAHTQATMGHESARTVRRRRRR